MVEKDGEPIGFALSLPDINYALSKLNGRLLPFGLFKLLYYKNKTKTIRTIIMGVLKEHRRKAIAPMLYLKTIENGLRVGFNQAECSWILENNRAMNRDLVRLGAKRYKTYRIYEKTL